ncbi:beta-N-acetylhexosaminidase [Verrucomicrobiaceae bacterium N1E253]|uniref:beta-N-acetylhexosaminidase n=1 Tax=Oceaniferula marina TaxID=2748318 RepID=A0A851GE79_9BACT|nr:beta-N-acetylhexosaminidase [Oceaniferula marina]NWK55853.1 beta-N-acetylhexosaminidase [Oceaniferula marina]
MKLISLFIVWLLCPMCPMCLMAQLDIFPTPVSVAPGTGSFQITKDTVIYHDQISKSAAGLLRHQLEQSAGYQLSLRQGKAKGKSVILFTSRGVHADLGEEGYTLEVSPESIVMRANNDRGFFYAVQSLRQLLPAAALSGEMVQGQVWEIDAVSIRDHPRYAWRSFMLDSGRQYHTVDFIKRYLDLMAFHKMNTFHWHLSENLGWRMESKKYPKLHLVGSKVGKEQEQQGYYTQQEMRELVRYAAERHITIVPEIDIPGHSEAAMLSYPELTCTGQVAPSSGHSTNIYCGGKDLTYTFTKDILDELCDIFPSPYIHVGGDEAPKKNWVKCRYCQLKIKKHELGNEHNLQIHLMNHLADVLKARGRKTICWDDVLPSGKAKGTQAPALRDNIVIAWWHNHGLSNKIVIKAVQSGREVICNPNKYTYLNFPVTPWKRYGKNRTFDLADVFKTDAEFKGLTKSEKQLILGWGAALWTDFNVPQASIDKRVFPRMVALTEYMWQGEQTYEFDDYYKKLKTSHYPRLKAMGVDVGPALRGEIPEGFGWD